MKKAKGEVNIPEIQVELKIEARVRHSYSSLHIQAAALFSRLAFEIEKNYNGVFSKEFIEHRCFITNTIFSTTAFLEAYINELFCDLSDSVMRKNGKYKSLESRFDIFSEKWQEGIPRTARYSILDKYQYALEFAGKVKLDKGSSIYQDIYALVTLRNALTHYEPEWMQKGSNVADEHRITKMLKPRIKELNPLVGAGCTYYPHKCMGHGLTEWAVESSIKFVDEFSERIGVRGSYNDCRNQLKTR